MFPDEPPNTTHPSGVFLATSSPACLVSPVSMKAWSMPIRISVGPLPRLIFSLDSPRSSVICVIGAGATLSLMFGIPMAVIEYFL